MHHFSHYFDRFKRELIENNFILLLFSPKNLIL